MSYYDSSTNYGSYLNGGNTNVWDDINAYLADIGLGSLSGWARQAIVDYGADMSDAQFTQMIRETREYKQRFKAIEIARNNNQPIPTEAEVLGLEKGYAQIAQAAGFPTSFYDSTDDFADLIGKGVSVQEYQTRVLDGFTAVRNNPAVQGQLDRLYGAGLTDGDLAAFFLDPDKATTAIELRQSAASLANRSQQSGFGQLDKTQAERLAGQGITDAQGQQGFAQLGQQSSLFQGLASENGNISTDTGLSAVFDNNAQAQDQLDRRRQSRQANFSGGGSYTANNRGNTGVGTAN